MEMIERIGRIGIEDEGLRRKKRLWVKRRLWAKCEEDRLIVSLHISYYMVLEDDIRMRD